MLTCAFVGTNQYDLDLKEKIQAAVKSIIEKNDEVEFLFYRRTEDFYLLCFMAVLKAKQMFPRKKITMTLIVEQGKTEDCFLMTKLRKLPRWAFDKITPVRQSPEDMKPSASPWKKIEREMVIRSDYVIACCYPELHDSEYELFKYTLRQRHVSVINLVNAETTDIIKEAIKTLPSIERSIVEKINEGCTYRAVASEAGISTAAIRTKEGRGRKRLRARAKEYLKKEQIKQEPMESTTCSIIFPGGPTAEPDEIITRFRQITDILIDKMGVSKFVIEQSNCPSRCMSVLFYKDNLELTVVTHYINQAGKDLDEIEKRYLPPFTKFINIDPGVKPLWARYLRGIQAMLEHSEYVVCNLGGTSTMSDRISRRIEKQRGITVIDLGKSPCVIEPPLTDQ